MKRTYFLIFVILSLGAFLNVQNHRLMAYQVDECVNLLLNGDLENDAGWQLETDSLPSQYMSTAFSGNRSLLIGPDVEGGNAESQTVSTARQLVTLPEDVTTLSFWYWTQSGPDAGSDQQYVGLVGQDGEVITLLLNVLEDSDEWQSLTADVSDYAGQTLWLYFGVQNDGSGDMSRMFIDEVVLCGATTTIAPTSTTVTGSASALPGVNDIDVYTFDQLGYEETILNGPFDSVSYRLGLPANWQLVEGVTVDLRLSTLGTDLDLAGSAVTTLEVLFNNVLIDTIALQVGAEQQLTLPIPVTALASRRADSRHELELLLDSGDECDVEQSVNLLVHEESTFTLPYQTTTPETDLRLFPRPIFQDSFIPEMAVLVVPDRPSATDLQAAFTIAAGLGQLSNSDLTVSLLTMGQLTTVLQEPVPLIFVGMPETLPILDQVAWPASLIDGKFELAELDPDDGLLQIAVSPWNSSSVVMSVSGASTQGLLKSAQAVSQGIIRVGQRPDLAVVTAVDLSFNPTNPAVADRTLADLGYIDQELDGRGRQTVEYEFTLPPGYIVGEEARIELAFSHSALLDHERSGLNVRLNDRAIGSARFEETPANSSRVQIALPRSVIHTGVNHLTVRAEMVPFSACIDPAFDGIWLTLWADSRLFLPLLPIEGGIRPLLDLNDFPVPFDHEPSLRDVAFVVPADAPVAWDTAAQLAFHLGDKSNSPIVLLATEFADQLSPEFRANHHLILVGLPTELPILTDMQASMPAPFEAGSNLADERALPVSYRLSGDDSVGYLELFPSPWSEDRAVLAVLGSTAQGVRWAGASLTSELRGQLSDNLAVIQDWQVVTWRPQLPPNSMPATETAVDKAPVTTTAAIEVTPTPIIVPDATPPRQPGWMIPVMIGSLGLMGLTIVVVTVTSLRQRRRSRK